MTGRVSGERRSEVGAGEIAGGRAERGEVHVTDRVVIAVAQTGGAGARVGFANPGDWSP